LPIELAGLYLEDPYGLLGDTAALRTTEPNDAVATDAGSPRFHREGTFLDNGPNGIVAEATDEVAVGSDHMLEELEVGIAAIDDLVALRFEGGPQLLGFRAVAGRDNSGFDGNPLEDIEMDTPIRDSDLKGLKYFKLRSVPNHAKK
jgi:hypothetical protein